MYQAIVTKYIGPTNTKPARISAKAEAGRLICNWDHSLGVSENHRAAAEMLAERLKWTEWSVLKGGALPGGNGDCVFVLCHRH